jgi:hypothetical protein
LQPKDFAIDGQALIKAFPNYSEDSIDRGTIVHLLSLEPFDTGGKSSRIALVEAGFDAFLYFDNASFDWFTHLLCLPSGISKNKNPSVLTKLSAEIFRLFDQLLPAVF